MLYDLASLLFLSYKALFSAVELQELQPLQLLSLEHFKNAPLGLIEMLVLLLLSAIL
uniref:Uncharacterized protein n=1 Tax=Anguilla anguilla TaxID=7936 RepID=A0A0E9WCU2_ANGAN